MLNKLELDILCARLMLQLLSPVSFLLVVFLLEKITNTWKFKKRQIIRWFQYSDWKNDLPSLRWLVLLFVVGLSIVLIDALFCWVTDCGYVWFNFCATKTLLANVAQANTPSSATVLLALYSAPAAYIIWWFRDANNRQQIENQRKDINLKDFQRLAEWAAGMHLPEDKVVESEKNTANSSEEKTSNTTETNRSLESFIAPKNHILHTPSRREGVASLQVAAIYQLQAFLQGDYGKQFQRPAFQLLKSIWLALVTRQLVEFDKLNDLMQPERHFADDKEVEDFEKDIEKWCKELDSTMSTPIGQAINLVMGTQQGWMLRNHAVDLPNAVFTGYNSRLAGLVQPLELDGLLLQGIRWQGANLSNAQLQRADLSNAQLQWTNLGYAHLQGAILKKAGLQQAILINAQMQGANLRAALLTGARLSNAQLQGANLNFTELQGASLSGAQLQGADLTSAKLQRADLRGAQLQGTLLFNTDIENACFVGAYTDDTTQVLRSGGSKYNVIKVKETFEEREKLRDKNGLVLPDILYKQLFAKLTKYKILNSEGQIEEKFGVGLRAES